MNWTYIFLGLILISSSAFALTDVNLLSWWKLDETSGTRMINSMNTAASGTIVGTKYILGGTGIIGTNYSSYGTSTYVDTNTSGTFLNGKNYGTIAVWARTPNMAASNDGLLVSRGASLAGILMNGTNNVYVFWNVSTNDTPTTSNDINDGRWHFIVATQDGTTRKFYVDGQQYFSGAAVNWAVTSNWRIGFESAVAARVFDGNLDEVSIWKGGLSSADINYLYNSRNGLTYCPATGTFLSSCSADPCAPTINTDWTINTAITCENKRIDLGTGKLVFNTGGSLKLYDSNIRTTQIKMNGFGKFLQIFARSFLWIK